MTFSRTWNHSWTWRKHSAKRRGSPSGTNEKGGKKKKWEDIGIEFTSYPGEVFRLVVLHDREEELRYVTNNLELTPLNVHMRYKQRWDMELLNKILKSNLAIDYFMAKNLNGMLIQTFSTLITYLLIALFQIFRNSLLSVLEIKRLIEHCGYLPFKKVAGIQCLPYDNGGSGRCLYL
jgi:IS4 transposase